MKSRFVALFALVALAGCADHSAAPPKPTSVVVAGGDAQTVVVGQAPATIPTFSVIDDRGAPMSGVAVTVSVVAGGGAITGAPLKTTGAATSVGSWRLGPKVGANQLKVEVVGLPALTISATGVVGVAAKLVTSAPATPSARVGEVVSSSLTAVLTDDLDNPIANAPVTVAITGGGTAPTTLTSDAEGRVTVGAWRLGTTSGSQTLTLKSGAATATFTATALPGDATQLITVSGNAQRSLAGTALAQPIVLRLADRYGNGVGGQPATLSVTTGGGSLASPTVQSAPDGTITISSWSLGKSVVPQALRATVGSFTADLTAAILTDYDIDVRFYGPPMTEAQRTLFTNAAARISAFVIGDAPNSLFVGGLNLATSCGVSDLPVLNETIDDLVIYASVRDIDGPRGILAQAGPCVFRPGSMGYLSLVGVMEFDAADMANMAQQGTLQDVITHEMLHVLGVGTLWPIRSLVQFAGTPSVAYTGVQGTRGCVDAGGSVLCATSVPVENVGGSGTIDSHWRESTFRTELMTGYSNVGAMPISGITVGSLADMGYTVNMFAADPFQIPTTASLSVTSGGEAWEKPLPGAVILDEKGGVRLLRRP